MKKLVLALGISILLGANSLFAYNMYGLSPNIIQMASSNGGSEYVYNKSITTNNHGGSETHASIDVYEVPTVTPNYVWIGSHMGHKYDDSRIEYNGYIIGYRHYYKFYSVSTGSSSEAMTVKVDGQSVDYLTVR
jgi:hypothetical protein